MKTYAVEAKTTQVSMPVTLMTHAVLMGFLRGVADGLERQPDLLMSVNIVVVDEVDESN